MSFTAINLDKAGTPQVIPQPSPENILAARKARLIELAELRGDAEYAANLKATLELASEPLVIQLEEDSYREHIVRQDVQDAGLGNMLAFARGTTLDHLGAFYGVARQIVQQADNTVSPPIPEIMESDDRLRKRIQLAPEGFTTAGSRGSYIYWGLAASPEVKDIVAEETATPGEVSVTVLSTEGDGTPSAELIARVISEITPRKALSAELIVSAATIHTYEIHATIWVYDGPDAEVVRQAAEAEGREFVREHHKLGHDITIAGLHAAIYREGVQNINLGDFDADLIVGSQGAAYCAALTVTVGGRNV